VIQIHTNQRFVWFDSGKFKGGVTKYVGGNRCCIIPAGYLGGAFWGGLFVACSGDRFSSTVVAFIFVFGMLVSLCYAPNGTMIWVTVLFIIITTAVALVEWLYFTPLLPFVTLYFGVFIGSFSVYDIYGELLILEHMNYRFEHLLTAPILSLTQTI